MQNKNTKAVRTLCVGDIHGGLRALHQVLERMNYDPQRDLLIFLGDYSDGWSETAQLIQYLIELDKNAKFKSVFLRGNHDAWVEKYLEFGEINKVWQMQGGQATIDSYIKTGHISSNSGHLDFFRNLHNYYVDEDNNGFVHGGFKSKHGLGHETYQSDYYWDRDMWELAVANHTLYDNIKDYGNPASDEFYRPNPWRFLKHKEVFIGHTTTCGWICKPHYPEWKYMKNNHRITVPMHRCNIWNLDTGGGWSGKLTAMDIYTKEFWQSDLVTSLYPEEKGR